ncbi:MAG: hypothetical protein K2M08_02170 [Anaeroplasmataceae bacterium]|nr:hypothetical protein [Anaeroplasmataceae bacterium]
MEKETNQIRIQKLNFKIKFLIAFSIIWSIFIIVSSILLFVLTSFWELATGFLLTLPWSIGLGGVMPVVKFKKEIKELKAK